MTAGSLGLLPRVALIVVALGLGTATLTLAATSTTPPASAEAAPVAVEPQELVVPDVRRQPYVFAKGTLEQDGFAWRVAGSVAGYAANTVVSQTPAPGARVVAKGAPTIVLTLARNSAYPQEGTPENRAPYAGTPARLVGAEPTAKKPAVAAASPKPAKAAPARPVAKPAASKPAATAAKRPAAFTLPGAPAEPLDEATLPVRAKRLAAWVEAHPRRTPQAVDHWLYQHNWIVTGARFGWADGAAALRTLVVVDARVQKLWGIGAPSELVARRALTEVEARTR
jgi:hypothetical protein